MATLLTPSAATPLVPPKPQSLQPLESLVVDLSDVKSNGYAFQIEMTFRAWKKGFRIVEIPIVFVDRTEGASKMSKRIVREAVWMVWRLRWWALRGRV